MSEQKFSEWVVLELMGHRRLAGLLSEQEIAGSGFLRIDIPGSPAEAARHYHRETDSDTCTSSCSPAESGVSGSTQFYAPGAVYAITPITEDMARQMANSLRFAPITRYMLRESPRAERELIEDREELPF